LQSGDCTVDRFEAPGIADVERCFAAILRGCRGEPIEVTSQNVSALMDLCEWIGNAELESALVDFSVGEEATSLSNAVDRILMKRRLSRDSFNGSRLYCLALE
jgi:hypothetical protein